MTDPTHKTDAEIALGNKLAVVGLPADYFQSEDYERFVESMVPHCHCDSQYRPCDGVLAGGLCDDMHDREIDPFDNEDDL